MEELTPLEVGHERNRALDVLLAGQGARAESRRAAEARREGDDAHSCGAGASRTEPPSERTALLAPLHPELARLAALRSSHDVYAENVARPRVFVSSTFYDLRQVRTDLERFIRDLGCGAGRRGPASC
jgi:hypothetical protein